MPSPSVTQPPKISRALMVRTAILLFVLGAVFSAYRYLESRNRDFDFGSGSAAGMIAAVKTTDDGSEVVLISPDGKIKGTDTWKAGVNDRDITWRPDGRFLFFTSDRTGNTFNVYRWNPDHSDAEARTVGSRGRTNPTFPADEVPEVDNDMLIISGGTILGLDPKTKQTPQLLPPVTANITNAESDDQSGGSEALFAAMYGKLGTSFRYARWCKGNKYIAAIIKRDGGEVLILQDMALKDGHLPHAVPVVGGDHIDFDVSQKDGSVVFAVQGFQWPDPEAAPDQFKKGNHISVPFRHLLGAVDPDNPQVKPIAASKDDSHTFASPAISPDGSKVLFITGPYDLSSQSLTPKLLVSAPIQLGGGQAGSSLVTGEVYEPSWSKDGTLVLFAMRSNGHRDIYSIHDDGSSQVNLTGGAGNFGYPSMNPQLKTASG